MAEAERLWNRPNEFSLCELPGPTMQTPIWNKLTEGNWMVCEPEAVNYCSKEEWCRVNPDNTIGSFDPHIILDNFE